MNLSNEHTLEYILE